MMGRWWVWGTLTLVFCWLPSEGTAQGPAPLSNADQALEQLGKEVADQSRPVEERLEVIQALAGWPTAKSRVALLALLQDPLPAVRGAAAQALGWPGNREAISALRERIAMPGEVAPVKAAVVRSLGTIGDPSVRALVVTATQDPDARVREAALWSVTLGPLVDPAERTTYLIQLAADRALDSIMRCDAIRALAEVKEDRIVDVLIRIIENEPRRTVELPAGQPTQAQVMALRFAQTTDVAAWAAGALGELEARRALPVLLRTAEDTDDFFLRQMSLRSLVAWNVVEAQPVFIRRLEDTLPNNRAAALLGLARLGDRTVIPTVLARLEDASPAVRAQAVATLTVLGDATVRPPLEALQQKEADPEVVRVLEAALSQLPR